MVSTLASSAAASSAGACPSRLSVTRNRPLIRSLASSTARPAFGLAVGHEPAQLAREVAQAHAAFLDHAVRPAVEVAPVLGRDVLRGQHDDRDGPPLRPRPELAQ